jgi:hypothetical protein
MPLSVNDTVNDAVTEVWLDIEVGGLASRAEMKSGLTRLGGATADVVIPGAPDGELHLWSDPPKIVHVSGQTPLEVAGEVLTEASLVAGKDLVWGRVTLRLGRGAPVIEELPMASAQATGTAAPTGSDDRGTQRVRAGLAIELGLADKAVLRRWQDAVISNEFNADACAREVLAGVQLAADDPRLMERSGRLLRDFLMSSLQRGVQGASRKARAQARSGTAYLVANIVAIGVYSAILLVIMVLVRVKWQFSFDHFLDFLLGRGPL